MYKDVFNFRRRSILDETLCLVPPQILGGVTKIRLRVSLDVVIKGTADLDE